MESDNKESVEADPKKLSAELSKDGREARELQHKLAVLGKDRSSIIRQLREINPQLSELVPKISELKIARDKETAAVKELKIKREQANNELKLLSPEMKKALDAKETAISSLSKSKGRDRKSASQLYSEMEALEMKIITEAMPFTKEKEIMKIVHEKRKQLEAVKSFSEAMKSHKELFSKFSSLRKQSYEAHMQVQKHAAESQRFHEEMIKVINKVKELREKKKELVSHLGKAKDEYANVDSTLRNKLHHVTAIREKIDSEAEARKKAQIEQKESALTDKLKSGKKLTVRDLLALQEK